MKTVLKVLILFGVGLSLQGCVKIKNAGDEDKHQASPEGAPQVSKQILVAIPYEFIGLSQPNQYTIRFDLREMGLSAGVVRKIRLSKVESLNWQVDDQLSWTDDQVKSGDKIIYDFGVLKDRVFQSYQQVEIQVPNDLVIRGKFVLDPSTILGKEELKPNEDGQFVLNSFHRLYFEKSSQLITNGKNWNIQVAEIWSDGGQILTFLENQKAMPGENGRSGGNLKIYADKLTGDLKIRMSGEHGGDGLTGKDPDQSLAGIPGRNGVDGIFRWEKNYNCSSPLCSPQQLSYCIKDPSDGADGGAGKMGYPGGPGGNGGDSGYLDIYIQDTRADQIFITSAYGLAGEGGRGGLGGEGGLGGKAGNHEATEPCKAAKDGNQGQRGSSGFAGPSGYPGNLDYICETIANIKKCY